MYNNIKNKWLRKVLVAAIWLIIWQIVSLCVDNSILLVGPIETLSVLLGKIAEISFWKTMVMSMMRIVAGFLAGWIVGLLMAALSSRFGWLESFLKPMILLMKTVPVASFVVLFLIWFRTDILAVVISISVVLPNVYLNTLEGIKSTDVKLLEMARVHGVHPLDKFFYIYRPALKPFWDSCMKLSIGMSWKSGVAAEVIGTPDFSIGEQLYMSKIYLDTAGVLAWTGVIILISLLCEKVFLKAWDLFMAWQPACRGARCTYKINAPKCDDITPDPVGGLQGGFDLNKILLQARDITKSYGEKRLFEKERVEYEAGKIYYFRDPSGSGKTTWFRMISGLEKPDEGWIERLGEIAYCFQENRLCEDYSALKNLELICGNKERAAKFLKPLLDTEDIHKPCKYLSGGMKRRVEVARAFASERQIILLDEPFAGLDEENRTKMMAYIQENGADKAVLIATHV